MPLSGAQEPYTKETYIQDCHENRRDDVDTYCECHYNATVDFFHSNKTLRLANEKEAAENSRQKTFKKLKYFSGVTESSLAEVCARTDGFWNAMAEVTVLKKYKIVEDRAKTEALNEVLKVEKIKAEDVFMSYKKSHGMISSKHTHEFDDAGWLLSTDSMSYCGRLKDLNRIEEEGLTPLGIPHFTGRGYGPGVKKCYALIKPAEPDTSMNTSR